MCYIELRCKKTEMYCHMVPHTTQMGRQDVLLQKTEMNCRDVLQTEMDCQDVLQKTQNSRNLEPTNLTASVRTDVSGNPDLQASRLG